MNPCPAHVGQSVASTTGGRALFRSVILLALVVCGVGFATAPGWAQTGLVFNSGSSQYVTFGNTSQLGLSTFTIECWFRRDGAGVNASTGGGGVSAVPLVTKGRGEAETPANLNMNYFLGIDGTSGVLVADFEDNATGLNHPVSGVTAIANHVWYHAAATYNGTTWRLFLNGSLERELAVGAYTPEATSIQHAGLATAMNSTGAREGYLSGALDEVRIWSTARTQAEIQAGMTQEITSGTGLVGRWGLNDGSGTTATNSVSGGVSGTLAGTTGVPGWEGGSPFALSKEALQFSGTSGYVTFGSTSTLGLSTLTLECWVRRDGSGVTVSTGSGGVTGVPLITKGRGEADGSNVDCNYFLGLDGTTGVLVADFEDYASGANHPASGVTALAYHTWYHVAATYDGTTWRLYLNGKLEAQEAENATPRYDSIQHAGLGTAMTSTGAAAGFLNGVLDEVRIWNYARSQAQILSTINAPITTAQTGLIGRWALNEGTGTTVYGSAGTAVNGTITGTNWGWWLPASFDVPPPVAPSGLAVTAPMYFQTHLSWTDNSNTETGFEIERSTAGSGGPFTPLATVAANITAYDDNGLTQNTEYCYRVRATSPIGASSWEGPVCVTTPAQPLPPDAPTDLAATVPYWFRVTLTWTDNASDETAFAVERSTNGSGGPFSPLATLAADATTYTDNGLSGGTEYCYRVRATGSGGPSAWAGPACATTPAEAAAALDFGPPTLSSYVTFGPAPGLGVSTFTLECWLRKDGTGATASTGTGGVTAVPLVTKGRGEAESPANLNMNYFFGIDGATGALTADFEDTGTGLNHPVSGVTPLVTGVWYHAAATYDGSTWRLYLNGSLDRELAAGAYTPEATSIQHAGLATAMNSSGQASGYFDGALDEVRIWNYARTQEEILATINSQINTPQTGLVARWGLNENVGTTIRNSAGTAIDGTIVGTQYAWSASAPFDLYPPAAPTDLVATAPAFSQVHLSWSDNSDNETGFEIERSTTGIGGTYSLLTTTSAGVMAYDDNDLTPETEYCYRVRATNRSAPSGWAGPVCITTPAMPAAALYFGPPTLDAYVTFGAASALGLSQFTIETWFRRDGTGTTANTGTGGVYAIPLVTKGRGESEASNVDMNWFLGIRASDNLLCADFEEGAAGSSPGLNHPVVGVTPIPVDPSTWHHAAVTYDGTTWRLYLDGDLERELYVGQPTRSDCTQHAGLATAMNSSGVTEGRFCGVLDEVRVWNYARTQEQIDATINSQLYTPQTGLLARWGLNEGSGTTVSSTAGTAIDGTIVGVNWDWVAGAPFDIVLSPPSAPSGLTAAAISCSSVSLAWTDNSGNETGFEIERSTEGETGPFTALVTVGAGVTSYVDGGLPAEMEYCYRVRAVNFGGQSGWTSVACATTPSGVSTALDFSGSSTYVAFGEPAALHLTTFTVECWFRRDGAGTSYTTGSGGITLALPLVTKGAPQADGSDLDMNWYLGIDVTNSASPTMCADFEDYASGANHPVTGTTVIASGVWYHAAVTYDGAQWRLYLNGNLEAQETENATPRYDSVQPAALATALTSANALRGLFDGALDEARVWDYARTQTEIQTDLNTQITEARTGLVARWGLEEGSGTAVNGTAGTTVNGTIQGTAYQWVCGAPFDIVVVPPEPPVAPSGLTATAIACGAVRLAWTDNSDNETAFEIQRSVGSGGPYTAVASVGAGVTTYVDGGLLTATQYCYQVRAMNQGVPSGWTSAACATTLGSISTALDFGGSNTHVKFTDDAALGLSQFTVECWFRRDGTGTSNTTGSGGITAALPLVTKGAPEDDGSNVDMNWFLGIDVTTPASPTICADFEDYASGLNHPVTGTTVIASGVWYHGAVTYDGSAWHLYLNGNLERQLTVGATPRYDCVQPGALATALTSGSALRGLFDGALDEVRVWNYARTQAEIQTDINAQIAEARTGLVARWGLEEGSGTTVTNSAGTTANGTILGTAYQWVCGAPFDLNRAPSLPVVVAPTDGATDVPTSPSLQTTLSDPDGDDLTVTYYGRPVSETPEVPDFTIIHIPDTQNYTTLSGGDVTFNAMMQWVVDQRTARNIAYVAHVGDIVETGDTYPAQWNIADGAMTRLETAGIPFGLTVGNHDQTPNGDATGTTTLYNQHFGATRFSGKSYYGGYYGSNYDDHYDLFSASGMDFIVIYMEYDTAPDAAVLDWADALLKADPTRRGIVVVHYLMAASEGGAFSAQGQATYDALKDNPNLFLMLCGHLSPEGKRTDVYNGSTVYTLLADYQNRSNGGDGWLRIMEFSPANDVIRVHTYSPTLPSWETDASSEFTLPYDMPATAPEPYVLLGTVSGVASGSTASLAWPGLDPATEYEWYVTVSDGVRTTAGPTWSFTTTAGTAPAPVANLSAAQVRTGNDPAGSTTSIDLAWESTPAGTTVEIWRAGHGDYPEYAADPPAAPGPHSAPGADWALAGTVAAPLAELADAPTPPIARDFYYYAAYVQNAAGLWSAPSTVTAGVLNYHLGDVASGGTECVGDNAVDFADVSLLGTYYGMTVGAPGAPGCLDVGPTVSGSSQGRPTPDNSVEFEDLVIFALNYGAVAAPQVLASEHAGGTNELILEAPAQVTEGTVGAKLTLRGCGTLLALSTRLAWDPAVVEPESHVVGEWLTAQGGVAFSPVLGRVDAAVLGSAGMSGEGELARVIFRVKAPGDPQIRIAELDGRDAQNQAVTVTSQGQTVAAELPKVTRLGLAKPNPFRQTLTIGFSLAVRGDVDMALHTVDGRRVRTLAQGTYEPGEYSLVWDGRDDGGRAVAAGVYYVRFATPQGRFTRTVTYLK